MSPAVAEHVLTVVPEGEPLPESVAEALARAYPYHAYRRWKGFGAEVPQRLLCWQLLHDHEEPGPHWRMLVSHGEEVLGLAWVVSRPWESQQLGHAVGALRHLIVVAPTDAERRNATRALWQALEAQLGGSLECVSHSVDVDDWVSIGVLQTEGFFLVDTLISFLCGREILGDMSRRLRQRCLVRPATAEDAAELEAIARACHFGGRYYHDPHVSREAADRLYLEWVRQCARKVFADEVVVGVRQGRVAGFLAFQRHRALEKAFGIRLGGRGLLAVLPQHKGMALDIVQSGIFMGSHAVDFGQFDIHLDNVELLRLYGRALRMDIAHVQHVFHGWLDAG